MDKYYLIKESTLVALGNAIRNALKTETVYTIEEMINILNNYALSDEQIKELLLY